MALDKVKTIIKPDTHGKYRYVISYETLDDHKGTSEFSANNILEAMERVHEMCIELFNLEARTVTNIYREEYE